MSIPPKFKQPFIRSCALTLVGGLAFAVSPAFALGSNQPNEESVQTHESYDFTDFDVISITGVYKLDIRVGEDYGIDVSGPAKEMRKINVSRDGDTLFLGQKKREKGVKRNSDDAVTATLTLPHLKSLEIAGVAVGEISGVNSDRFDLEIGGVGELSISGSCGSLNADIAGVGEMTLEDLKCKTADVDLAGIGELSVYASEKIDVSAAGIGSVNVYGNPKNVSKSKSFLSTVTFHD